MKSGYLVRSYRQALEALASGDHEQAFLSFERVIEFKNDDAGLWVGLGWSALETCRYDRAREAFEKARGLDPDHGLACQGLVLVHLREEKFIKALEIVDEVLSRAPGDLELRIAKIAALMGVGRRRAGSRLARLVLAAEPEARPGVLQIARSLLDSGWSQEAYDLSRRCLRLDPQDDDARAVTGACLVSQGKVEEGVNLLVATLDREPGHLYARAVLARVTS